MDGPTSNGLTAISGVGSRILVTPRTAGNRAFDTDRLNISDSGLLDMAGGQADIDFALSITSGTLAGDGLVNIFSTQAAKLFNAGTIRAEGGTLTIRSADGGSLDIDGDSTGLLEAVDGNATLVIDGEHRNPFNGMINIGAGNTIQIVQAWETEGKASGR